MGWHALDVTAATLGLRHGELLGLRRQDLDLVFPTSIGPPMEPRNLSREFTKVRERAGMPGVRLHDLRHTVVSLLLDLGTRPTCRPSPVTRTST